MKQKSINKVSAFDDKMILEKENDQDAQAPLSKQFTGECIENNTPEAGVGKLPDEIWFNIFTFFGNQEALFSSKLACKRFLKIASDKNILNYFPNPYDYSRIEYSKFLTLNEAESFHKTVLSPNGEMLAAINSRKKRIDVWDTKSLKCLCLFTTTPTTICVSIAFTKDNKYLVLSYQNIEDWNIDVWDIKGRKLKCSFPLLRNYRGYIASFDVLSKGLLVISYIYFKDGYDDSCMTCLEIYDIETKELVGSFIPSNPYNSMTCSPDETLLICTEPNGVDIYDIKTKELIKHLPINFLPHKFESESDRIAAEARMRAVLSNNNQYIICNALGNDLSGTQIQIWNIASEFCNSITISAITKDLSGLIFSVSKNGRYLAVARNNSKTLTIWNIQKRECIKENEIEDAFLIDLFFTSSDNKIVITNLNNIAMVTFPTKELKKLEGFSVVSGCPLI